MEKTSKIFVAGHRGLVGSAITKQLQKEGYHNLILKTSKELDLTDQKQVNSFFEENKPEYVFLAAAKVGGILANSTYPADFIYINLMIASNVIHASYKYGVKKLLNLGSSCIYPKVTAQPMKEEALLTGALEPTNEPYAIAKISAIKLCSSYNRQYNTNFISAMPCNLYGEGDNFDLETSHFLPALVRKFHEAKEKGGEVELFGDGTPRREMMLNEDLALGCLFLMKNIDAKEAGEFLNIGVGEDYTIYEIAQMVKEVVGFKGEVTWNSEYPNGTMKKLMDVSKINRLGWKAKTTLKEGIPKLYNAFLNGEGRGL